MKLSDTAAGNPSREESFWRQRKLEEQTKENAALRKEAEALRKTACRNEAAA